MKRYIVFLKQVPQSTRIGIDPTTKTLKRTSGLCRTNPDDLCALQAALDLKQKTGAEVVAVSMGPASAQAVLREALQHGADRALLLSSPAFAGSDTWCTATVLAAAVRKIGHYDLLFFGRMAIDGDTAQVGPEVAGQLDIPQVTQLLRIDGLDETRILVSKKAGERRQQLAIDLPCALLVSRENGEAAPPTLAGWRWAQQQPIPCWDEQALQLSPATVGLHASPTQVVAIDVPQHHKHIQWLDDAAALLSLLPPIHPNSNNQQETL